MKVILGKKYIDRLGNISTVSEFKDFFDVVKKNRFSLTHSDNIGFITKKTVGRTTYEVASNGSLVDASSKSPFNLVRRFTLKDEAKLIFSRLIFKLAQKFSPKILSGIEV